MNIIAYHLHEPNNMNIIAYHLHEPTTKDIVRGIIMWTILLTSIICYRKRKFISLRLQESTKANIKFVLAYIGKISDLVWRCANKTNVKLVWSMLSPIILPLLLPVWVFVILGVWTALKYLGRHTKTIDVEDKKYE